MKVIVIAVGEVDPANKEGKTRDCGRDVKDVLLYGVQKGLESYFCLVVGVTEQIPVMASGQVYYPMEVNLTFLECVRLLLLLGSMLIVTIHHSSGFQLTTAAI